MRKTLIIVTKNPQANPKVEYPPITKSTVETGKLAAFIKERGVRKNLRDVGRELKICGLKTPPNLKEMLAFLRGESLRSESELSKAKKKRSYIAQYNKAHNNGVKIVTDPRIKAACKFWANALFY